MARSKAEGREVVPIALRRAARSVNEDLISTAREHQYLHLFWYSIEASFGVVDLEMCSEVSYRCSKHDTQKVSSEAEAAPAKVLDILLHVQPGSPRDSTACVHSRAVTVNSYTALCGYPVSDFMNVCRRLTARHYPRRRETQDKNI